MKKKHIKIICIILPVLIILAITAGVQLSKKPIDSSIIISSHTKSAQSFIAHRGFSSVYPENTIPAIEGAVSEGFYGCEFDIHTTKDGEWVLNHNSDIDKMTDGSGDIKDYTFDELQNFNIDNGNGIENFSELKIPKLEDALIVLQNSNVIPFIEIKGYDPDAFRYLIEIIDSYNFSDTAVIISFDMEALLGIRDIDKDIELMYLTNNLTNDDVDICKENGNIGVNINGGNIFKMRESLRYAQEAGLKTAAWTVDIPLHADLLGLFGIKYITTNRITP